MAEAQTEDEQPRGELSVRVLAMPADANANGDIFGGWVLSQMDLAGGIAAEARSQGRIATVAIQSMQFHLPVFVGDVMCAYADLIRVGRTSMTYLIEAWVIRRDGHKRIKVTQGEFTYVAIGEDRRPRVVPEEG